jgi:hypothetical protein
MWAVLLARFSIRSTVRESRLTPFPILPCSLLALLPCLASFLCFALISRLGVVRAGRTSRRHGNHSKVTRTERLVLAASIVITLASRSQAKLEPEIWRSG